MKRLLPTEGRGKNSRGRRYRGGSHFNASRGRRIWTGKCKIFVGTTEGGVQLK